MAKKVKAVDEGEAILEAFQNVPDGYRQVVPPKKDFTPARSTDLVWHAHKKTWVAPDKHPVTGEFAPRASFRFLIEPVAKAEEEKGGRKK